MKWIAQAACLLACLPLVADEEVVKFTSDRAIKAQKVYEKSLERLKAEYESKVRKAQEEYAKSLEVALKDAKKARNDAEVELLTKTLEDLRKDLARGPKPAKSGTGREEKIESYIFAGGNGESIETAVIIKGAEDSPGAVDAEGLWLKKHYPKFRKTGQGLLDRDKRKYDEIEITGPDEKTKKIYFDITECFGFPELRKS